MLASCHSQANQTHETTGGGRLKAYRLFFAWALRLIRLRDHRHDESCAAAKKLLADCAVFKVIRGAKPRLGGEWQEWRDSNPRPSVLETDALPTELHSCALSGPLKT